MDCAACAIQIEAALADSRGIVKARVHFATQRARVTYDSTLTNALAVAQLIEQLGYSTEGTSSATRAEKVRARRKQFQLNTGIAAFCAMQIMMFSVPRYLGGDEIEPVIGRLMDGSALVLTLPVLLICMGSFLRGARREITMRRIGMDTAICVSTALAFAGSIWHVWQQSGALYFDSIAMFAALLLSVRWWEWERRERNRELIESSARQGDVPSVFRVERHSASTLEANPRKVSEIVSAADIEVGDRLLVANSETFIVDAELCSAETSCDESSLTGESNPAWKRHGDLVLAGTINLGGAVTVRAIASYGTSSADRLLQLADESARPQNESISHKIAAYFLPIVASFAAVVFIASMPLGLNVALERMIAVLIVSCPCAIALASPAARARAFAQLLSIGVLVRRSESIERLAQANSFVLDKTGTLTRPTEVCVEHLRADFDPTRALTIIAALERGSNHPLARAIRSNLSFEVKEKAVNARFNAAIARIYGYVGNLQYSFGRPINSTAEEFFYYENRNLETSSQDTTALTLEDAKGWICSLSVAEIIRVGAYALIDTLKQHGSVSVVSGDSEARVKIVAESLSIPAAVAASSPQEKADFVRSEQSRGRVVAMIGDGVNDSIGFAGADIAIAANGALDGLRASADIVCTAEDLSVIASTINYAKRVASTVRQNYAWAVAYNALALPFAALGYVTPLLASLGMAVSSAIVVLNVTRLRLP